MHTLTNQRHPEYQLQENQPMRVSHAAGLRIECLAGKAWITMQDQLDDVTLLAGDSYLLPSEGLALVEAVGAGRIRIVRPAGALQALMVQAGTALVKLGRQMQTSHQPCGDLK